MSTVKVRLRRTIVIAAMFTASAAFVVPASAHSQSGTDPSAFGLEASSQSVDSGPANTPLTIPSNVAGAKSAARRAGRSVSTPARGAHR